MKSASVKKYSARIIIPVLLWLSFTAFAQGQLVQFTVNLQSDTIQIGERTSLILSVEKDAKVVLRPVNLKDSLSAEIEIIDSVLTESQNQLSCKLVISSFTPGVYTIPEIPLIFTFDNTIDTLYSGKLIFTVLSPEINSEEIRDIKPPLNLPFKIREILPETGIGLALGIVMVLLILFLIRLFRKKGQEEIAEEVLPAHIIAIRELDRIKEEKLWQNGKIKEFYSRLSDTIRVYIEMRFGIPAMENVSSQTLRDFRKLMPDEDLPLEMLRNILETADMVKFAKGDPLAAENQGNLDNAYLFVGQTKEEELIIPEPTEMEKLSSNNKSTEE